VIPFVERSDEHTRYGFQLLGADKFDDFYTNSEDELEAWLKHLSKI
jgi:hypothetical protein